MEGLRRSTLGTRQLLQNIGSYYKIKQWQQNGEAKKTNTVELSKSKDRYDILLKKKIFA